MDSVCDLTSWMGNKPSGQTNLIVFCSGGFEDLDPANSEGELLSELVDMLKMSGAKYTILYASQPSGLLEKPSNLPLGNCASYHLDIRINVYDGNRYSLEV
jgi:hypothetical protein